MEECIHRIGRRFWHQTMNMKKRFINLCLIGVLVSAIYRFADKYVYSNLPEKETIVLEITKLSKEEKRENHAKNNINNTIMQMKEECVPEKYYGAYEITEFWMNISFARRFDYDLMREQEADMMLGHIVEIRKDSLVTYECYRWKAVYNGQKTRTENYRIEKVFIENPQYEWDAIVSPLISMEEVIGYPSYTFPIVEGFEDYREKIRGRITITLEEPYGQRYYVMDEGIIMYSTITGQYFYLKKLDKEPDKVTSAETLSEEEKEKIIQEVYGNYTITEFMPTKFYPALDVAGDIYLPQEEADMMIGKKIIIDKQLFTTYDNGRLPNSEFANRAMDEYLLERIEIETPDYQIERKLRDDIFGLRDDMLPEEMRQEEYIEINVKPGYGETIFDEVIPQIYLLNDGRRLLYAMGEYFLLEKDED